VLRAATIGEELGVGRCRIVNDFGAVAHAVAHLPESELGTCADLTCAADEGLISVVGGHRLGVAMLLGAAAAATSSRPRAPTRFRPGR
jgi:glucokinase